MKRSAILTCVFVALMGCNHDEDPHFDVLVTMMNSGAPISADLISVDDSTVPPTATIPEEFVVVRMENNPRSDVVATDRGSFLHDFHLQRYTVTWRRVDGGPSSGAGWDISDHDFEAATSIVVPIDSSVEFSILIAPGRIKQNEPFFSALANFEQIMMIADIDFVGTRGVSSEHEIHVPASLSVNFADFADE